MSGFLSRALLAPVTVIACLLSITSVSPGAAATAAAPAGLPSPTCSWYGETDQRDVNVGAPDLDAYYWASPMPATAGATAVISGSYPAARYFSFHSYNTSGTPTGTIYDREIAPDPGSRNPYRGPVGKAAGRKYTVHVVVGAQPKHPARNTMYVPVGTGPSSDIALLVYRVYVPTDPSSPQGGVPFPQVTIEENGSPVASEQACSTTPPPFGKYVWSAAAATNYPEFAPTPTIAGATKTPTWARQFGSSLGNLQNAYLATTISRQFGDLVVIHGKAPTFPNNRAGVPPYRKSQVRYWSFCIYDVNGQTGYGCAADYDAAIRHHHYTYVVSDPDVRPANAIAKNGVTWLPWGGTQAGAQVMMRNLLPSPTFHHAAEDITKPSQNKHVRSIMGAYFPKAVYCAPALFLKGGWRACFAAARKSPAPLAASPDVAVASGRAYTAAPTQNRYTAANGFAMMHGDTASSDTTPVAGPGRSAVSSSSQTIGAVCPSILVGSDGMPVATCTNIVTRKPTLVLINPQTGAPLATHAVAASGSALGGVYTYLDQHNRVVIVDGDSDLLRVGHVKTSSGWTFRVDSTVHLGSALSKECGSATCDTVVGLAPDSAGRVWFATQHGEVGVVFPDGRIAIRQLPRGEIVGNSISTNQGLTAVVTDHALYLLRLQHGRIELLWRHKYDRGGPRKPGQLTDGSGTTPVFFGPHHASTWIAIVDNARPREHLLVFRLPARGRGPREVCSTTVLRKDKDSGTEDAVIGYNRSVVVTDTYGYPYPSGTTGTSSPSTAPFQGGMTRVDMNRSGNGCHLVWDRRTRSAGLPRLSLANNLIETVISKPLSSKETQVYGDSYYYAAISERTGEVVSRTFLGTGPTYDALQLVGTTTPDGVMYQGTLTGYLRIVPS